MFLETKMGGGPCDMVEGSGYSGEECDDGLFMHEVLLLVAL